jgi:hypothetical protein
MEPRNLTAYLRVTVSAICYLPVVDPVTAVTVTVTNHMHIYGNRQPSGRYLS